MNPFNSTNQTESTSTDPLASGAGNTSGMDPDVFWAAKEGNLDALRAQGVHLEKVLTATKSTVLHVYLTCSSSPASLWLDEEVQQSTTVVREILNMCPPLLMAQNEAGDTALHIAARHGGAAIVKVLIEAAKALDGHNDLGRGPVPASLDYSQMFKMIRATNKDKNTALHEAVRFNHLNVVEMLTTQDPEFSYSANDLDETPLYLAAERGYNHLVSQILGTCKSPDYQGPNGRTALHAAVLLDDAEIARGLLETYRDLTKATDEHGFTPLHLAASHGHPFMISVLLEYDRSAAYVAKKDNKMTAIHFAACNGNLHSMIELMTNCPDCCEMVDYKGQNVLHHAAKNKQYEIMEFILTDLWLSNTLSNGMDVDGNTPLHMLAGSSSYFAIDRLVNCRKVDELAFNKKSLNVLDLILANADTEQDDFKTYLQHRGFREGHRQCPEYGSNSIEVKRKQDRKAAEDISAKKEGTEDIGESTLMKAKETQMLVATLIATVSFAAGIAMPGGYGGGGFAVLARNAAFRAFVITNTIAMAMSSCSVLVLLYSSIHTKQIHQNQISTSFNMVVSLIMISLVLMVLAFITGTYAVLAGHSSGLAISASVLACFFFFVLGNYILNTEMEILDAPNFLEDMLAGFMQLIIGVFTSFISMIIALITTIVYMAFAILGLLVSLLLYIVDLMVACIFRCTAPDQPAPLPLRASLPWIRPSATTNDISTSSLPQPNDYTWQQLQDIPNPAHAGSYSLPSAALSAAPLTTRRKSFK